MKKRIISTLVTATVALTAFWGGQMTNATVHANEKTYIAVEDIVDWNTRVINCITGRYRGIRVQVAGRV